MELEASRYFRSARSLISARNTKVLKMLIVKASSVIAATQTA